MVNERNSTLDEITPLTAHVLCTTPMTLSKIFDKFSNFIGSRIGKTRVTITGTFLPQVIRSNGETLS